MLGFHSGLMAVITYLVALALISVGGWYGLIASDGHPVFLAPIAFGLLFGYIFWLIFSSDLRPPKRGGSGTR